MELRTLRYFLAAAQEGNITRAAESLHLTQPTLSRQIMDLERELGVTLVLRGKNGLTLTDDGILFRQRAQEIVELADRLEKNFAGRQSDISGMVVIGASEVAGGQTMAFLVLSLSQVIQAYNMRSDHSLFRIGPFSNHKLNWACLISFLLVDLVLFTPVRTAFSLTVLPLQTYLAGFGLALAPVAVMELSKALGLIRHRNPPR